MALTAPPLGIVVTMEEEEAFIVRCMRKVGTDASHAKALADVLATADYWGQHSYGMDHLKLYVADIQKGVCERSGEPVVVREQLATALVDGRNVLGPIVGKFCMELAVTKAREAGIGWVVARGSNCYGIAGYYSRMASSKGMIGMTFTSSYPEVAPAGGKKKFLGTNPISVAANGKDGDSFVLDVSTAAIPSVKIKTEQRRGRLLPAGIGMNSSGELTVKPEEVLDGGALLPLGGTLRTGGYKGFGLALMVELFCGVLGGARYGSNVQSWQHATEPADLGQCFVAIDPAAFAPGFEDRLQDLMNMARSQESGQADVPVLVPGDVEKWHMAKTDADGAIGFLDHQIELADEVAARLGVEPIKRKDVRLTGNTL